MRSDLGKRLRELRSSSRKPAYKQEEIAEMLGCSVSQISDLELGKRSSLTPEMVNKLCDIYSIDPDYLFTGKTQHGVRVPRRLIRKLEESYAFAELVNKAASLDDLVLELLFEVADRVEQIIENK